MRPRIGVKGDHKQKGLPGLEGLPPQPRDSQSSHQVAPVHDHERTSRRNSGTHQFLKNHL